MQAAFALGLNAVSAPIETERGFHVLKATEKIPAGVRPYPEVRHQVRERAASELRSRKMEAWMSSVRARHQVQVFEAKLALVD